MAEIIGLISSVVGLLTAAEVAYTKIKEMKGLPQAFDEVARRVPLAQQILNEVESQSRSAPESTVNALLPVVHSCKENAEILRTTLEKLQPEDLSSAWSLDRYVSLIKMRGKKGRVEDLMAKILQDIYTLASYKTIHAATSEELAGLKTAIEEVESVKASAPDNLLEDGKGVNISHGGQGPMLNHVGDYTTSWNHFGSGHINHVQGDAHFGATQDERKREALRRLNASSYESHKDRNPPATANTCRWFVEHQNFRDWLTEKSSSLLWVSADPGCGKSVLARHLIENILPTLAPSSRIIYFFFKDDSTDQRSSESALRGLLHQLLSDGSPLFTKALLKSFEELGDKMFDGFSNLWKLFLDTISQQNAGEVMCVLDALDECHVGWDRLIKGLGDLCGNSASGFKSILLSRPYGNIESDFRSLQGNVKFIRVRGEDEPELTNIESEIEIVIRSKVKSLKEDLGLTQEAQELLFQQLCQTQNRTYLWVHLVCDMLRTVESVSVLDSIQRIPKTVEEAYDKILNQGRDRDKAKLLLHIVVAAHRPLSLDEMATAFAIESHKSLEISELRVASAEDCRKMIRNVCGLFVVIKNTQVYLIHQTAREFLVGCNTTQHGLPSLEWKSCLHPHDSNETLAKICIRYLDWVGNYHPMLEDPEMKATTYCKEHTLLEYAAKNWVYHYRDSNLAEGSEMGPFLFRLCKTNWTGFRMWYKLFYREHWTYTYRFGEPPKINLDRHQRGDDLNLASYFGIAQVCERILETGSSRINDRYWPERRTALSWAAGAGHLDVVQLFLKKRNFIESLTSPRVDLQKSDANGNTPLHLAAKQGKDAVVRALLATGRAGASMQDNLGHTALSYAAVGGHTAVVQALLDDGSIGVNSRSLQRTPLSFAAQYGHKATVRTLLAIEKVDVDSRDSFGRTPLVYAACGGHTTVVQALIATGKVDVDSCDYFGRTPLIYAVYSGHQEIVKMIIKNGKANVNSPFGCHSPLASVMNSRVQSMPRCSSVEKSQLSERLELFKYLYNEENARVDPSKAGSTLWYACKHGHLEVLEYLLDAEQFNIDTCGGDDGRTLLMEAVASGEDEIVRVLLQRNADVNILSHTGKSALNLSVLHPSKTLQLLLDTKKVNPMQTDEDGWTARLQAYQWLHCRLGMPLYQKRKFFGLMRVRNKQRMSSTYTESECDDIRRHILLLENYAQSMTDRGKALGDLERRIVERKGLQYLKISQFYGSD